MSENNDSDARFVTCGPDFLATFGAMINDGTHYVFAMVGERYVLTFARFMTIIDDGTIPRKDLFTICRVPFLCKDRVEQGHSLFVGLTKKVPISTVEKSLSLIGAELSGLTQESFCFCLAEEEWQRKMLLNMIVSLGDGTGKISYPDRN